jgi:hypothetical protein
MVAATRGFGWMQEKTLAQMGFDTGKLSTNINMKKEWGKIKNTIETNKPTHFGANKPTHFRANKPTHFGANKPTHFGANKPTHFRARNGWKRWGYREW